MIDVSIIIVSYKSTDEIILNLKSIKENITSLNYEILVVNNYMQDDRLPVALKAFDNVRIIDAESNLGFGKANNLGLKQSKGRYVLFVNPDVIFLSDINQLTVALENDREIGLIGPVTYNGNGKILPSCGEYPCIKNYLTYNFFLNNLFPRIRWWGNYSMKYFSFNKIKEVDWISGAFMLGRRSVIEQIEGFDKDFFMYGEDVDICWRLKKLGFKIIFSDKASIIHTVGHAVQNKSAAKARMLVESSRILWGKYYNGGTVKKLFLILRIGSLIRKTGWQILNLVSFSKRKNMIAYYNTLISEADNYLKG